MVTGTSEILKKIEDCEEFAGKFPSSEGSRSEFGRRGGTWTFPGRAKLNVFVPLIERSRSELSRKFFDFRAVKMHFLAEILQKDTICLKKNSIFF